MSLIGKTPITIPQGVTVTLNDLTVTVKGPKGELAYTLPSAKIKVEIADNQVMIKNTQTDKQHQAYHGLVRSLINNMVVGTSVGFEKRLELVGTGYRAQKQGPDLNISLGYSHPVIYHAPEGITLETEGNNIIIVKGASKQVVGQVAAEIRAKRPPEPYKGKGIKYADEIIRRKAGKTTSA